MKNKKTRKVVKLGKSLKPDKIQFVVMEKKINLTKGRGHKTGQEMIAIIAL